MTTESTPDELAEDDLALPPARRLRRGFLPALAVANLTVWIAFFTPIVFTVQLRVQQLAPDHKASVLSVVLLVSSILSLITNPLSGRLSDRTTSAWGMRRPWLVGGVVVGFIGLVIMGIASTIPLLIVGSCISQIGFATCQTVILSLLSEQVPTPRRGAMGALLGVGQALGIVVGVGIAGAVQGSMLLAFALPGVLGVVGVGLVCGVLQDRVLDPVDRLPLTLRSVASAFWFNPRAHPNFGWAWLSRFLIIMAFAGVTNYQVYYLTDQIGVPKNEVSTYVGAGLGIQVATVVIFSIVGGWASDRLDRRKPFVLGAAALAAVALLIIGTTTSLTVYFVGVVIGGIAQGIYLSVDLALIAEILPDVKNDNAKDFGVMALANQLPQTISPAVAPLFLAIGFGSVISRSGDNYTAFFVGGALFAVCSVLAISRVRGVR